MPPSSRQRTFAGFDEPTPPAEASRPTVESPAAKSEPTPAPPFDPDRPLAGKTVYLVDSHSLIYQVFHALPEMTGPGGQPVGAVHGFIRDIVDLVELRGADYVVATFDHPSPTFRHEMYKEYKVNREEMPADLQLQIPVIHRFLDAMGIPTLSVQGFEADDILATVARQVEAAGGDCFLVTSDKDCRQLITDRVRMFNIRKGEIFDAVALQATWGIRPDQVVDFQSLVGDKVDNIPGVAGIGPKNAQELLVKYETLEEVFAHVHEISGAKRQENLIKGQQVAISSRELVRLKTDVPVTVDWSVVPLARMQPEAVAALSRECGFRQIAKRLEGLAKKLGLEPAEQARSSRRRWRIAEYDPEWPACCGFDHRRFSRLERDLPHDCHRDGATRRSCKQPSKSRGCRSIRKRLRSIRAGPKSSAIRLPGQRGRRITFRSALRPASRSSIAAVVRDALRPMLENPAIEKIGQNMKYDMIVLRLAGVELRGAAFDTMVADYLLDPGERSHNMDDMARRHLGHQTITIDQLIGTGKNQKRMDEVPVPLITQYAAEDADVPLRLMRGARAAAGERGPLGAVHRPGNAADRSAGGNGIQRHPRRCGPAARAVGPVQRADHAAGAGNLRDRRPRVQHRLAACNSAELLFNELKLPVVKRTKTGPSTDAEVLEELALLHPLPAKIIEYRHNAKLKSTYIDALQELVHPRDRPRPHLVQAGRGRDGPAQLAGSEPAEHSDPHRARAGDPLGLPARPARLAADDGRLFADRAARAGPFFRRRHAAAGVCRRPRHSHPGRQRGLWRAARRKSRPRCGAARRR